ncbi:Stealth CR1 domain-containing protein [Mesorhizobium sp. RP14(2022)]|uniref:Stealth CR1 domain-containing protein n=1 Tax=Mesorhizobium liriopis TaxID=2953882 RepID=A0ABT1CBM6_9HYPH|nr:Stealth CR1 domain-containing protein [Mesorhizobium liriopis]MCO6052232.1 Stealth CR1 domain-containing protein [Mesorhizobium liriopis]
MPDIDFVITWVDGSDRRHLVSREQAATELGYRKGGTRLRQSGEIYYLIASIIRYAPFFRRIYVVTDNQKLTFLDDFIEAGLCRADQLQLVSHDVIFDGLDVPRPTFNSLTIEAAMWRIPGLAEHFVYSNDDMFLNAPLEPEDFFQDGAPVIGGTMTLPDAWRPRSVARKLFAYLRGGTVRERPRYSRDTERGAVLAGHRGLFLLAHHRPHPLRRSTAEAFYSEKPDVLRAQLHHRFRHTSQYLQVGLSNHLERKRHGVRFGAKKSVVYIRKGRGPAALKRSLEAMRNASAPFGCVQSLERFSPEAQAQIHATLTEKFKDVLPPRISGQTIAQPLVLAAKDTASVTPTRVDAEPAS